MNESVHMGVSPSVIQNQSIEKKAEKWESLLLNLLVFAILLPAAAQSISAGLIGLTFLFRRRWRSIDWNDTIPKMFRRLIFMLLGVWGIILISGLKEVSETGVVGHIVPYLRLIGKQGLWGAFVMAAMIAWQKRRMHPFLNPKALLFFSLSLLTYAVFQRYLGWDWVHGFEARLGPHRFAYGVFRVSGWMDHPLTFAFNLMLFTLASAAQGFHLWNRRRREARFWLLHAFVLLVLLVLTESRFPLILTLALLGLGWAWDFPKSRKFLLAGLTLILGMGTAFVLLLPREGLGRWGEFFDANAGWEQRFDRIVFWKVNWQVFKQEPWFGTGLTRYNGRLLDTYLQAGYTGLERKYHAHNIYLQTLADGGVFAGISLIILLAAVGRLAFLVKKHFDHSGLVLVFLATLGGGLVQNQLRDTEYLFALWASIGLCLSWSIVQGKHHEPRPGSQLQDLKP